MFERVFGKSPAQQCAGTLYAKAVEQARWTNFYAEMGVPDTIDGRFDMVALHVFLILRRLKQEKTKSQATAQALFDTMFINMEHEVRELGAGDLGVSRRVKAMARAFYGRVAAYDQGLDSNGGNLREAVLRNVFRGEENQGDHAESIASYIRNQVEALAGQSVDSLLRGHVHFADMEQRNQGQNRHG